jgi:hypothetical protein
MESAREWRSLWSYRAMVGGALMIFPDRDEDCEDWDAWVNAWHRMIKDLPWSEKNKKALADLVDYADADGRPE